MSNISDVLILLVSLMSIRSYKIANATVQLINILIVQSLWSVTAQLEHIITNLCR